MSGLEAVEAGVRARRVEERVRIHRRAVAEARRRPEEAARPAREPAAVGDGRVCASGGGCGGGRLAPEAAASGVLPGVPRVRAAEARRARARAGARGWLLQGVAGGAAEVREVGTGAEVVGGACELRRLLATRPHRLRAAHRRRHREGERGSLWLAALPARHRQRELKVLPFATTCTSMYKYNGAVCILES